MSKYTLTNKKLCPKCGGPVIHDIFYDSEGGECTDDFCLMCGARTTGVLPILKTRQRYANSTIVMDGKDIGRTPGLQYIKATCIKCNKIRWPLFKSGPPSPYCSACATRRGNLLAKTQKTPKGPNYVKA